MINHARTLLLNYSAGRMPEGAEFIDPSFSEKPLVDDIKNVRNLLFPYRNVYSDLIMVPKYLSLIHAPELEAYTLSFDNRITYPISRDFFDIIDDTYPVVSEFSSTSLTKMYIKFKAYPSYSVNSKWVVEFKAKNSVSITMGNREPVIVPVSFYRGISKEINILKNNISVYFTSTSGYLNSFFRYTISFVNSPLKSLSAIEDGFKLLSANSDVENRLFYKLPATKPLSDIYHYGQSSAIRTGAIILGYIYNV